jgi:hypothetical protein
MKLAIITVGTKDDYGGAFDIDVGNIVIVDTEDSESKYRHKLYNLTKNENVHWWAKRSEKHNESIDWEYLDYPLLQLVCD